MTESQPTLSQADATARTDRIRDEAGRTWALLVAAHDEGAWVALGYNSWDDYVTTEFDPAADPAYRLVDRARVGLGLDDEEPSELELSDSEADALVSQVVLSLEALSMGLDMVDLSTLPKDAQAAAVVTEAIGTLTRLRCALATEGA